MAAQGAEVRDAEGVEPTAGIDVGSISDFPEQQGRRILAATLATDYDIAIINDEGTLYAIDDECTHALAHLSEGWVEDGCVECPLHSSEFDLKTGVPQSLPATEPVHTHRLEVVGDRVLLYPGEPRRD